LDPRALDKDQSELVNWRWGFKTSEGERACKKHITQYYFRAKTVCFDDGCSKALDLVGSKKGFHVTAYGQNISVPKFSMHCRDHDRKAKTIAKEAAKAAKVGAVVEEAEMEVTVVAPVVVPTPVVPAADKEEEGKKEDELGQAEQRTIITERILKDFSLLAELDGSSRDKKAIYDLGIKNCILMPKPKKAEVGISQQKVRKKLADDCLDVLISPPEEVGAVANEGWSGFWMSYLRRHKATLACRMWHARPLISSIPRIATSYHPLKLGRAFVLETFPHPRCTE
jgi:hypothetical protein